MGELVQSVSVGVSVSCGVGELDGAGGQGEQAAGLGRGLAY